MVGYRDPGARSSLNHLRLDLGVDMVLLGAQARGVWGRESREEARMVNTVITLSDRLMRPADIDETLSPTDFESPRNEANCPRLLPLAPKRTDTYLSAPSAPLEIDGDAR